MTITAIEFVFLASGNMTDYSVGPSHWITRIKLKHEFRHFISRQIFEKKMPASGSEDAGQVNICLLFFRAFVNVTN